MYSLEFIDKELRRRGYVTTYTSHTDMNVNCKLYTIQNICVQVRFEHTPMGTRVDSLCLIDNSTDRTNEHYLMTTLSGGVLFKYTGISFKDFLKIALSPLNNVSMRIENMLTKYALEAL
jgi:hypothetical protein